MVSFDPLCRNPHWQTVAAHLWKRDGGEARFPIERRSSRPSRMFRCWWNRSARRPGGGEIVMVHGLEGSGEAGYMRSLSAAALRAGFAAHRFHMRTCGGTERLLPHALPRRPHQRPAGRAARFAAKAARPCFWWASRWAATWCSSWPARWANRRGRIGPRRLRGFGAARPGSLRAAHRPARQSRLRARFVRRMRARLLRHRALPTGATFAGLRSVSAIDDRITAPSFGFGDAANYYRTQSAIRIPGRPARAGAADPGQGRYVRPFRHLRVGGRPCANPWIELPGHRTRRPPGFLGRRPNRFLVG
jgi:hypothetical protein